MKIKDLSFHSILTYAKHKLKDKYKIKFSKACPSTTEVVSNIFKVSNFYYKGYTQQEIVIHFLGNDLEHYYNKITKKSLDNKSRPHKHKVSKVYKTLPNHNEPLYSGGLPPW